MILQTEPIDAYKRELQPNLFGGRKYMRLSDMGVTIALEEEVSIVLYFFWVEYESYKLKNSIETRRIVIDFIHNFL